ncbi:MAG: nitronate monooxygenase, partial [Cyanobacteria bacterium REEB65]|nr:nitronate monooxygenase [Cyanobacteria bacterium REEB65]
MNPLPRLIQGGMGIGVSSWQLARAVAQRGHLGVVSGTAVDLTLVRRLQDGDPSGDLRRALASFPAPEIARSLLDKYFRPSGRRPHEPYKLLPMLTHRSPQTRLDVCVLGAYCEVWLARHGQPGPIGINLLTKVQLPTLPVLYGAMLAGVDAVIMGAGIPRAIPGALDVLSRGEVASLTLEMAGHRADGSDVTFSFDPARYGVPTTPRPSFLAIVSSQTLAMVLAKKASGSIEGFVVESPVAGGHNAPPRGPLTLSETGEPLYGERDSVEFSVIAGLGLPFWIAGGMDSPEALSAAHQLGATGVQVGTLFAYCRESGMDTALRQAVLTSLRTGSVTVRTDPRASSTGYPFKVVDVAETVSR